MAIMPLHPAFVDSPECTIPPPIDLPHTRSRRCILVVEDDDAFRSVVAAALESDGFAVATSHSAADARERLNAFAYDALIVDLRLPDDDGREVLTAALRRYPGIPVIVMTGSGDAAEAVEAMKLGAADFLFKPFKLAHLSRVLESALEAPRLRLESAALRAQLQGGVRFESVLGQSASMRALFKSLELISPLNSTVLISGETGTGKELIARSIHKASARAGERFVAFNSAAIPEPLAEAELFGHVKGAFTGAVGSRVGRFELAHRGTLFIDEVGLMSMSLQAKLLRAIQEREIERVGDSKTIKFDARIIAATNVDLKKLVKEGTFREDLYYRLNVVKVALPSLRERREDIPLLVRHFVQKSCASNNLALKTVAQEAMRVLMNFDWPGNVRQLENAVEHAVAMAGHDKEIAAHTLPEDIIAPERSAVVPTVAIPDEGIHLTSVVSELERDLILRCLEKTGGNKRQAARLLNLSRTTLIDKLQRLNAAPRALAAS
jgi:DNA-binding NtrC family response regulator